MAKIHTLKKQKPRYSSNKASANGFELGWSVADEIKSISNFINELSAMNSDITAKVFSKRPLFYRVEQNLENAKIFNDRAKDIYQEALKVCPGHYGIKRLKQFIKGLDKEHEQLAWNYASKYKKWGEK